MLEGAVYLTVLIGACAGVRWFFNQFHNNSE